MIWIAADASAEANKDRKLVGSVVALYFAVLIGYVVRLSLVLNIGSVYANCGKGIAEMGELKKYGIL